MIAFDSQIMLKIKKKWKIIDLFFFFAFLIIKDVENYFVRKKKKKQQIKNDKRKIFYS